MRDLRARARVLAPVSYVQNLLSVAEPEGGDPGGSEVELVKYSRSISTGGESYPATRGMLAKGLVW